jgi:hypothetical protein
MLFSRLRVGGTPILCKQNTYSQWFSDVVGPHNPAAIELICRILSAQELKPKERARNALERLGLVLAGLIHILRPLGESTAKANEMIPPLNQ